MRPGRSLALLIMAGAAVLSVACGSADSKPEEEAVPDRSRARAAGEAPIKPPAMPAGFDAKKLLETRFQFTIAVDSFGVVNTVYVHGGKAFSRAKDSPQFDVVFDLLQYRWIDVASGTRMTFAEGMQRWKTASAAWRKETSTP